MKKRKMTVIVNWITLAALISAFVTGLLLKGMPGMWLGISHGVSATVLVICSMVHCLQHGMLKK